MTLVVKQNKTPNSVYILRFRADTVALYPQAITPLVEQFGGGREGVVESVMDEI